MEIDRYKFSKVNKISLEIDYESARIVDLKVVTNLIKVMVYSNSKPRALVSLDRDTDEIEYIDIFDWESPRRPTIKTVYKTMVGIDASLEQ